MSHPANAAIDTWLALETEEAVLEPALPIVDPHHHLWDLRTFEIEPHASFEQKVYLCEEMAPRYPQRVPAGPGRDVSGGLPAAR